MKRSSNHSSRRSSGGASSSFPGEDRYPNSNREKKKRFTNHNKRIKLEKPVATSLPFDEFPKLDQCDPVHARRIQQRRRMVAYGKNTVGYDEYLKKVPKHNRRPRCMKHPMTPDHTLDIPTKRWQGLVRAWRKALHQYDPEDLMKSCFAQEVVQDMTTEKDTSTVQGRQIADASTQGLPVDFCHSPPTLDRVDSPSSVETQASSVDAHSQETDADELDAWESARRENDNDFLLEDDDSDDDLL